METHPMSTVEALCGVVMQMVNLFAIIVLYYNIFGRPRLGILALCSCLLTLHSPPMFILSLQVGVQRICKESTYRQMRVRACGSTKRRRNVSCTIVRFDGIIKLVSKVQNSSPNVCKIASLPGVHRQCVCFDLRLPPGRQVTVTCYCDPKGKSGVA